MYLYEAIYYFKLAEIGIEKIDIFNPEMMDKQKDVIKEIGINTLYFTLKTLNDNINKLLNNLSECSEKEDVKMIQSNIKGYLGILNSMKNK